MPESSNQRAEPRYAHRTYGQLITASNSYSAHIINLSASGALIAILDTHDIQAGTEITLEIETDSGTIFTMKGSVTHTKEHYVGLQCEPDGTHNEARMQSVIDELEARKALSH